MKRILAVAATLQILALWPTLASAQPMGDRDYWGSWGWGHMMFGGVMMFAFWGAIILLVVLAVRWMTMSETFGRGEARRGTAVNAVTAVGAVTTVEAQRPQRVDHLDPVPAHRRLQRPRLECIREPH